MRPNPLHWASFKNHIDVVELLLKTGFHWEDVDGSGNNSVMLSAAGSAPEIFKVYLQYGVSLE
jgi:ankyrin repeat protein